MHAPHVFIARFYGYQYTYATLAALCLGALRRADPERFARDYVAMLEATGTGFARPAARPPRVRRRGSRHLAARLRGVRSVL